MRPSESASLDTPDDSKRPTGTRLVYDAIVIGGGLVGSSVAMHLAELGMSKVMVIDVDLEGVWSSSELNAGGVRATWVQPINRELSRQSIHYLDQVKDEVGYRACGYLWLYGAERLETAQKALQSAIAPEWPLEFLDQSAVGARVPFIDKRESIAGGIFGPRDGLVNPNLLKKHYRVRARERGVQFRDRTVLRAVEKADQSAVSSPYRVVLESLGASLPMEKCPEILATASQWPRGRRGSDGLTEVFATHVVNCAGAWAPEVARMMGYTSPSRPVRRQVCVFETREVDLTPYGMIVEPGGVYFHPEATQAIAGFATPGEPDGYNFHYDGESFFQETIWPALYEVSTGFERLRHVTGWAGLYEVSPDHTGILGPVVSRAPGLFEAHSFSGHGVMQSYAAGLALAERMVLGRSRQLDITPLSADRFETGALVGETLVI